MRCMGYRPTAMCIYVDVMMQDGQSRTVRQFQFTEWPEQGVPKSGEGFIDFVGQVHKTKEQFGQDGPITVHCRCSLLFCDHVIFVVTSAANKRNTMPGGMDKTSVVVRDVNTDRFV